MVTVITTLNCNIFLTSWLILIRFLPRGLFSKTEYFQAYIPLNKPFPLTENSDDLI